MAAVSTAAAVTEVLRTGAALGLLLLSNACAQPPPPDVVVGRPAAGLPLLEQSRSWSIAAVNGRETPGGTAYSMRFVNGQLSARFGCNFMGGAYRIDGARLTVPDLSQTLMGCPEPASSFEREGAAILREPMQIDRDPVTGGTTLSNRNGRIDLVPIVTGRRL